MTSGYSKRSLRNKLGIKSGHSVVLMNTPLSYIIEIGDLSDVELYPTPKKDHDFIHIFVKEKSALNEYLHALMRVIKPTGTIWVSWPKKSSKTSTDITEDTIREVALPLGLVDVKVASVDETWSALKLVIRKENR
jgi:hypothetical protein